MAIQAVSGLTGEENDAFLVRAGEPPLAGRYTRDADTGDVQVAFESTPDGPVVLVLVDAEGTESRYPGAFVDGGFVGGPSPSGPDVPIPTPLERAAARAEADVKAKAGKDRQASAQKAAADKKAADKAEAAEKKAAEKKAAEAPADGEKPFEPRGDAKPTAADLTPDQADRKTAVASDAAGY